MADRFPLIANSSANQIQELASGDTLDLTGNMIDNAVNVKAIGITTLSNTTDSTSSTTGALIVSGGVGIAKNVYIGAGLSVAGTLTYEDVTSVDSVGLITAKSGINITGGSFTQTGGGGLSLTGGGEFKVGTGLTVASTSGVATFAEDVTFVGAGAKNVLWDKSNGAFQFDDDARIKIGDSADLSLYHDGTNSYIQHGNQGNLRYQSGNHDFYNQAGDEFQCRMIQNDAVTLYYDSVAKIATTNDGISVTGIVTATAGVAYTGLLRESFAKTDGKISDNTNIDLAEGMVHYFTTAETTTSTPNIRWNSSKSLNNMMNINDTITVTIITTAAAAGYQAQLTIDGSAVTEQWVGGSAPAEGGADGYDILTYNILKTASATFFVIGNLVNAT